MVTGSLGVWSHGHWQFRSVATWSLSVVTWSLAVKEYGHMVTEWSHGHWQLRSVVTWSLAV